MNDSYAPPAARALMLCLALAAPALAGPLNPPSGPIAPTARFGERIELSQETTPGVLGSVFRILNPGSYFLAEDLTVPAGTTGIRLEASDVTIDLNGYTIRGEAGSINGIQISSIAENVAILNGTIRDVGGNAISTGSTGADRCLYENITALNIGARGFRGDESCIVRNCVIDTAQFQGIELGRGAIVENCVVRNLSNGDGYIVGPSSRVTACVAEAVIGGGSVQSDGDGFQVGSDSIIAGCLSVANANEGFETGDRCFVVECSSVLNSGLGFRIGETSRIERCLSTDNLSIGIVVDERSSVINCQVARAGGQGIALNSNCVAIGNTVTECLLPQFSGIVVASNISGCIVDSNLLLGNANNMNIFGTGNTIVRNFSQGATNTGINIAAGNFNDPTISLPSGGGLGFPSPWSNIDN